MSIIDFSKAHRDRECRAIADRINIDFDGLGVGSDDRAWNRALWNYAEEIYRQRMADREAARAVEALL